MEGDTGNQNHRGEGQGGTHTTMDRGGGGYHGLGGAPTSPA